MKTFHPTFHAANIGSSPRLQRALSVLKQAGNLTGWEWCEQAGIMNPGGVASELAQNGYDIEAEYMGKNQSGRKVWRYIYYGMKEEPINCLNCRHCHHSLWDHGEYAWLPNPHHPQAELKRVSEACGALIDRGGDLADRCDCERFEEC